MSKMKEGFFCGCDSSVIKKRRQCCYSHTELNGGGVCECVCE